MGVRASMSISLIVEDRLWGLVICHHYGRKFVSYDIRAACDFLSQTLSWHVAASQRADLMEKRASVDGTLRTLINGLADTSDLATGLTLDTAALLALVDSGGAALVHAGQTTLLGATPTQLEVDEIVAWLRARNEKGPLATDQLAKELPAAQRYADVAAGLLAVALLDPHGRQAEGNVETGVVFAVGERLDSEAIADRLFWSSDDAQTIDDKDWAVGQVGDAPGVQPILEVPPILSATIETAQVRCLRLHWREDAPIEHRVGIRWTGRDWLPVQRTANVPLTEEENPTALLVRGGESDREWLVPVVDAAGRVGWQPPRFDTYADALAALLDFPIRPAEATDDGDGDEDYRAGSKSAGIGEAFEQEKIYALHAAAELVEKVASLQAALPASMLDDWLDHLDRMFRASFPESLIATWRMHRLDVFAYLREPELRSPHLSDRQRVRYFEVLAGAARAWGLR